MSANPDEGQTPPSEGAAFVLFWRDEVGRYREEFKSWEQRVNKIIRRYRDERPDNQKNTVKFNILWSNIETLGPAVYSRAPEPIVNRRFLDQDFLANISSQILERGIDVQLEVGRVHETMEENIRLDYLLGGRGQVWVRYEAEYTQTTAQVTTTETAESSPEAEAGEADSTAPVTAPEQEVSWEKVCVDYVHWSDFMHTPARVWAEVWWVGRRIWMTREEGTKRFGDKFKTISLVRPSNADGDKVVKKEDRAPKAEVWEIWDRANRQVYFIAPDHPSEPLEKVDDPLRLHDFWPCPCPLYATTTNDTLVPVPDYSEYQDQAEEIDRLSGRIAKITAAIKVVGLFDAAASGKLEIQRMLNDGVDNMMIPVDSWAAFAEKGGINGTVVFLPIKDLAAVLINLYEAREASKRDLYEITGMSDIIRGQSSGAAKTATEQRIKGQFASMRLDDRRKAMARFVRDVVAIVGEIVAEHFSPETLVQMTGIVPVIQKQVQAALPPPPQAQPGIPQPDQQAQLQQATQAVLQQALTLLKDDKMRTFRIDIETDSTIEADAAQQREEVVEFMGGAAQFLNGVLPVVQLAPPMLKPLAETFMAAARRMRFGRSLETAFEGAFAQLEQMVGNQAQGPQGPSPEEQAAQAKGQAEQLKAKAQVESTMIRAAAEQRKMQTEAQLAEMEAQLKQRRMELEAEEMDLQRQKMLMQAQVDRTKAIVQLSTAQQPRPSRATGS